MSDVQTLLAIFIFTITIFFMMWNPWKVNETVPTAIGASLFLLLSIVPLKDISNIFNIVSGASFTIISTIIMSLILDSIGFFQWVAYNIVNRAKGSGTRLFIYINLLCYLMTLFFNNDGSVLITTPIIIKTVNMLGLKPHQKMAILLPGALTATATSAPIAISNIANLIALKIVGLDLNDYVKLMFIPSMLGIISIIFLLYLYFKKDIPKVLPNVKINLDQYSNHSSGFYHPLADQKDPGPVDWGMFKICITIIIITRGAFFLLTPFGIPVEWIAITGAMALIIIRWYKKRIGMMDILKKTPWHILLFAFSMYILVYGLKNIGLTHIFVQNLKPIVDLHPILSIFTMGGLLTVLSNTFNNLPAVMIGTLTLTDMHLNLQTLQVSYLANIIGSDIGALITPIGTLATMLWMFILREHSIPIHWKQYLKVTIIVIPVGLIISLTCLYFWSLLIFN